MTIEALTRPGFASIRIGGIMFTADNFHISNNDARWLTGIFTDLRPWKKRDPDDKAWFVVFSLFGFCVGVCR